MNGERKGRLVLSPIHPFTEKQGELIELRANGLNCKQIAELKGIAYHSILEQFSGSLSGGSIYERISWITGKRPTSHNFISPMIGDVLFFREE